MISSPKTTEWVTTPAGKEGGHVKYLYDDKLNVKCDPDYALSKAMYELSANKKDIRYAFTCNPFPGLGGTNIVPGKTDETPIGNGEAYALKNLKVDCKNRALASFRLRPSVDSTKIYYEYACGNTDLKNPVVKNSDYFNADVTNGYPTYDLNGKLLDCGNNILTAFRLDPKSDNSQYRYTYTCAGTEKTGSLLIWAISILIVCIIITALLGYGAYRWFRDPGSIHHSGHVLK